MHFMFFFYGPSCMPELNVVMMIIFTQVTVGIKKTITAKINETNAYDIISVFYNDEKGSHGRDCTLCLIVRLDLTGPCREPALCQLYRRTLLPLLLPPLLYSDVISSSPLHYHRTSIVLTARTPARPPGQDGLCMVPVRPHRPHIVHLSTVVERDAAAAVRRPGLPACLPTPGRRRRACEMTAAAAER